MSITVSFWGNFENKAVSEYTITNKNGVEVGIINYGGAISKILTPDKNGIKKNITTGFETLEGYLQKENPYFGALIGRYSNRICNGRFVLNNITYNLATNNDTNTLHGGEKGFDKVYWIIEKLSSDNGVKLKYFSKDGEEGFPGNLHIEVVYTLTEDNMLTIEYKAITDKATPINLTNHAYFNLSEKKEDSIFNHELIINADNYIPVNDKSIPIGIIKSVKNGPMDFTTAKLIGKDIDKVKGGYDHCWVLNKSNKMLEKAATLYHPESQRIVEVFTTEPGIQFYTGNFLDGKLTNTKNGLKYCKHNALCLEAQHFPDSPNQSNFPNTILNPSETYLQTTVYKFSINQT
jgi:aldose 1-epimerase